MPRLFVRLFAVLLLTLPLPAMAQSSAPASGFTEAQRREIVEIIRRALKEDPTILRDAVAALQAEDSDHDAAAAKAAIARHHDELLATAGDPVAGNPDGTVTLVEFYDVRCPYCRKMLPVMGELVRRDPKLRIVFKDIPILGPASLVAARAVLAAQRQGAYLKMREALMTGTPQIDADVVHAAAQRLGLDWPRLQRDMADPALQTRLDANIKLAHAMAIDGTPAYIIGDELLPGAVGIDDLQKMVALARKS